MKRLDCSTSDVFVLDCISRVCIGLHFTCLYWSTFHVFVGEYVCVHLFLVEYVSCVCVGVHFMRLYWSTFNVLVLEYI